ncbi:BrnA antitoxin family protein [bacterium]|nr:BrnA antitoxin family protein [bacterium]
MKNTNEKKDRLPEEFSSYEEAGKFWDTHDSTDYLECMTPVEVDVRLDRRHFEINVDEEVVRALEKRALSEHISASKLANSLLRRELVAH